MDWCPNGVHLLEFKPLRVHHFMKYLTILLMTLCSVFAANQSLPDDPWEDYSKKHDHPVVPEPSTYGAIFVASAIIFVALRKRK